MSVLPVITAIGGISAAGRSSCHYGYQRLIYDALPVTDKNKVLASLQALTHETDERKLLDGTLIRRLPLSNWSVNVAGQNAEPLTVEMRNMDIPNPVPADWIVTPKDKSRSLVTWPADSALLARTEEKNKVQAAGQLPTGFDPSILYNSRNHPRGLQMAIYGASDALSMLGLNWSEVLAAVPADKIAVYSSSAMSQLDEFGLGGMVKNPANGQRITSKQCPLGLASMPADFINAYVLGSIGRTGALQGACATFLYNLSAGVADIRSGKARVVMVGASEAPLVPEVMEGYRAMGALAEDADLLKLDPGARQPDWRRACRPFANNCGFTIAESAQYVVLMDDTLALELGANILASVPSVYIHADGVKKSISSPGAGNYLTMGKAMAVTRQLLGDHVLRHQTCVSAHGTSTPQNRITESLILERSAEAFGIERWPITAVKSYLGHPLAAASGDQLMAALGTFDKGVLPGILTTHELAEDVYQSRLQFALTHQQIDAQAVMLNSKGFGGNNASAPVFSPDATLGLLKNKHGLSVIDDWQKKVEKTRERIEQVDQLSLAGKQHITYRFGEPVITDEQIKLDAQGVQVAASRIEFEDEPGFDEFL